MQKIIVFLIVIGLSISSLLAQDIEQFKLESPSGNIIVDIQTGRKIYYQVRYQDQIILSYSPVSVNVDGDILGENPEIINSGETSQRQTINPPYGTTDEIRDEFNELRLDLKDDLSVIFRVCDQGVAYRLMINKNGEVKVYNEEVKYKFPSYAYGWFPEEEGYETNWSYKAVFELDKEKKQPLPVLTFPAGKINMAITEADVHAYPSLFLQKTNDFEMKLKGVFEKYPLSTKQGGFNNYMQIVNKRADYIASLDGNKTLPWRVLIITEEDKDLLHNTLVYQLASPSAVNDVSWIEPGQVAWDWWHDYNLENVDFETGINTKTYLYHVDFAAEYDIPYINIDWKWTDAHDIFVMNPDVDVPHIIDYARERGVGVILWTVSYTLYEQLEEALDLFSKWGAAGIKVDFFGRDDQKANQMYEDIAREASERKLLVNFHGCARPTGLERKYPNIVNYEAVKGLEGSKWNTSITPDHDVLIPFIRQLAGPMDYTPGAMRNFNADKFKVVYPPGSQGTRCHQLSMYVVYHQPLVMLCDMPTAYQAEPEYTKLLTSIPASWDESVPLKSKIGNYAAIARRNGDIWFVGILNNSQQRNTEVDLSFLDTGEYMATVVTDNINANKTAWDYDLEEQQVNKNSKIPVNLEPGGGAFLKIKPVN